MSKIAILSEMRSFIEHAKEHKSSYCSHSGAFSRSTRLSFERCLGFLLNSPRKSLSVELTNYFEALGQLNDVCSKSAWVQARQQILPKVFVEMNEHLCQSFSSYKSLYADPLSSTWSDLEIYGVDGSTVYLPQTEALRSVYGVQTNGRKSIAMARAVVSYDLRYGLCYQSYLGRIDQGEEVPLAQWICHSHSKQLYVYDRGFPSYHLFYLHDQAASHFLARMPRTFSAVKDFIKSGQEQAIVAFSPSNKNRAVYRKKGIDLPKDWSISLRLIRVELPGGQIEVLASTLTDSLAYPIKQLAQLYFERWKVETFYDRLKHQLNLELFSGHLPIVIEQDFFASIVLANLQKWLVLQAQALRDTPEGKANKKRTYDYQINHNVAIGLIKNRWVKCLLLPQTEEYFQLLICLIARHVEPIRPDRKLARNRRAKKYKGKYQYDQNYKQAM